AEFDLSPLRFSPVGSQHKHADSLLCLSECRSADFQNILQSLEFDGAVHAQIRTSTWRYWTSQRSIDLKCAFASRWVDAGNLSIDQTIARVDDHFLPYAHATDLCFRNS